MATTLLYATPWVLIALALAACGAPAMSSGGASASDKPKTASADTPVPGGIQLPPCRRDFNARDTDADQFITLDEWLKSEEGKTFIQAPEAAFAQKDSDKDGKLSPQEFGCDF